MNVKKIFMGIIMSVLMAGILAACGGANENGNGGEAKKLVMLTSADYPPYEFIDTEKGNEIVGFDVDIARYITEELGYELDIVDMDFTTLITAMNSEKGDFILAGMTPTPDRMENADFSDVYFTAKHLIVSEKASGIESIEDLAGKTVGVQTGSIQEGEAEKIKETVDITIETRNRVPELVQEILAGRFDAAIIEDTVAAGHFKNNPDLVGFAIEETGEAAGSAIAFPKDSELTDEFNRVLNEMKENGELDKLILKWFGGEE
ncbi:polar amino acid transport system substrate-binding protein [Bacillus mesophilus]|uniref:Transporter substrate-binding domain-containing protein n=1 Tax=Bacillus mesophilus TaxID=1808955 RepID=A0A6M0Q968_9BACI|nr:transporter substrate-binding domain-containing protein [Bacillus mesophilus]MBM7662534.1 polar amino acid transport system substrate-binding protein [Bacillus mesophilus]NEY72843.1 transporter substrate-binding domain-containing protein [Bacillus mesophilus]